MDRFNNKLYLYQGVNFKDIKKNEEQYEETNIIDEKNYKIIIKKNRLLKQENELLKQEIEELKEVIEKLK